MKPETENRLGRAIAVLEGRRAQLEEAKQSFDKARRKFFESIDQAIREDRPMEKNPSKAKFSFVDSRSGKVYGRTVVEPVSYDTDAIRKHPILSQALLERKEEYVDEDELRKILAAHHELLPEMQKLVKSEKSYVKLMPVRDVKDEDII